MTQMRKKVLKARIVSIGSSITQKSHDSSSMKRQVEACSRCLKELLNDIL